MLKVRGAHVSRIVDSSHAPYRKLEPRQVERVGHPPPCYQSPASKVTGCPTAVSFIHEKGELPSTIFHLLLRRPRELTRHSSPSMLFERILFSCGEGGMGMIHISIASNLENSEKIDYLKRN